MSLALSSQESLPPISPRYRVILYGDNRRALLKRLYKWQRQQRLGSQQVDIVFLATGTALPPCQPEEAGQGRPFRLMICQHSTREAFEPLLTLALALADEALFLRVAKPLTGAGERDNVTAWQSAQEPAQTDRRPVRNQHAQISALHHPG